MAVTETNRSRWRAILISQEVKRIFRSFPLKLQGWLLSRWPRRWIYRAMFTAEDGRLHRGGEILLADLRDFAGMGAWKSPFDTDALVMARRIGRQDVVRRITDFLNLDEASVQLLMELDDGLGE